MPIPKSDCRVRNLVDAPTVQPRGGGSISESASQTGRELTCVLPVVRLLANADVLITDTDGHPIRAGRTLADGTLPIQGLVGIDPGQVVIMTARKGEQVSANAVKTIAIEGVATLRALHDSDVGWPVFFRYYALCCTKPV